MDRAEDVTCAVLAGGQSRRMGRDKALVEIGGEILLARVVGRIGHLFRRTVVIGPAKLEGAVPVQSLLEGHAADIVHDEVRHPLRFVHGVDRYHVVVYHRGGRLGFPHKALACGRAGGELGRQNLDRHETIEGAIEGLEDHSHAALADTVHNLIRS